MSIICFLLQISADFIDFLPYGSSTLIYTQCEGAARWDTRKIFFAAVVLLMEDAVSTFKDDLYLNESFDCSNDFHNNFPKALLVIQLNFTIIFHYKSDSWF